MKVYFKNGTSCPISNLDAKTIADRIGGDGAKTWQLFYDNGVMYLAINLAEVTYIR